MCYCDQLHVTHKLQVTETRSVGRFTEGRHYRVYNTPSHNNERIMFTPVVPSLSMLSNGFQCVDLECEDDTTI